MTEMPVPAPTMPAPSVPAPPEPTGCPDGSTGGTFTVAGNRIAILPDGAGRLDALLALIAGAGRSLRLLYYIYTDDGTGRAVRDALIDACGRGVTVSLMVDGFGSGAGDAFFQTLKDAGAHVCRFVPRYGRRYLLRNHQKLALADEARVIVGGFNIEDGYFGRGDAWRDLGLLVEGPCTARMAGYYDALVDWAARPKARLRDLRALVGRWSETEGPVRWLLGGPTRRLSPWALTVRTDMARAQRIDIISAYFAPSRSMLGRMRRVARAGGEVRLMTAARSDNRATIAAARHLYPRLMRRGVLIYEYMAAKLHTKLFVIDDIVHLGSANFDIRSLYLNMEIMLRIEDPAFAEAMRGYVEGELAHSTAIDQAAIRVGWAIRLRRAIAYFMVAVVDGNVTRRLNFGPDGR